MTHNELLPHSVMCPYCGEYIDVLIDNSVYEQQYVEDCQVCCAPINFHVQIDSDGDAMVRVQTDSE